VLLASVLLGEPLTLSLIVSAALILGGVLLASR
jgi:drug/metabolite transporter (DMT)-like permease